MPQQPAISTDRLGNVIQVIQLGQKTGTLIAERDSISGQEHGMISFVHGQMNQAVAETRSGLDAFRWLSTWGTCRFSFTPNEGIPATEGVPALPSRQTFAPQDYDTDPLLRAPAAGRGTSAWAGAAHNATQNSSTPPPQVREAAPYQVCALAEATQRIERAHLSRLHRRLFLLINGQRTVNELARLIGRGEGEVQRYLRELEHIQVIQQA